MNAERSLPDDSDHAAADSIEAIAGADSSLGGFTSALRHPAPADLIPGTSGWRTWVASWAHTFFRTPQNPDIAAAIGKPVHPTTITPWSVADYSKYLNAIGLRDAGKIVALNQIINALEHAGFLMPCGHEPHMPEFMARRYMTQGGASPGQVGGLLWLSKIFGAELIIPSYNTVTVQISGTDTAGRARSGTGLVLDHWHIVTNKHVAAALAPNAPIAVTPSNVDDTAEQVTCQCIGVAHKEIDVAIIKCDLPDGVGIPRLAGMAFRDPEWADEVYLFGYPHVPMIAGDAITVQRGEVVNPSVQTPAVGGLPRQKTFLYSAIARPGNSGGPVVAQDGRVIGLVVEDSSTGARAHAPGYQAPEPETPEERLGYLEMEVDELKAKTFAPSFYRGIPSSEIIRALNDLEFGGLASLDGPQP